MKQPHSKASFLIHASLLVFLFFLMPCPAHAMLQEMDNAEMDSIQGHGGVAIGFKDIQIFQFLELFHYEATDNGYLEFGRIKFHDGHGGPVLYNFGTDMSNGNGILWWDVGVVEYASTDDWNAATTPTSKDRIVTRLYVPNWDQDYAFTIGDFIFSDGTPANTFNLGQLDMGPFNLSSYTFYLSTHEDKAFNGIDWEYDFQNHIENISYAYNFGSCDRLTFKDIYFGENFDNYAGDDPADPSTWKTSNGVDIGQFKIGDILGDLTVGSERHSRPAQFDVGQVIFDGTQYIAPRFSLPMSGSIRFEKAEFGDVDFGPGAIDGLEVYRMDLYLVP